MLNHPTDVSNALNAVDPQGRAPVFGCPKSMATPAVILEKLFEKHGRMVARYPWLYIIGCLVVTVTCGLGLPYLQWENNIVKMWNPSESETFQNFAWLWKNHPPDNRIHSIIYISKSGKNVLTPESLKKMYQIHEKIQSTTGLHNSTWKDACLKVPVVPSKYNSMLMDIVSREDDSRHKPEVESNSTGNEIFGEDDDEFLGGGAEKVFDPSVEFYPNPYCTIVETFSETCFEDSILELFGSEGQLEKETFEEMTQQKIVDRINGNMISDMFMIGKDFHSFLGGVTYDEQGRIVSAEATLMFFFSRMNVTEAHLEQVQEQSILGDQLTLEQLDANTKKLEDNLIEMLLIERENLSNDNTTDLSMEFMIAKSFPDTINKKITANIPKIAGSFLIMFVYVCLSLGNLNCVENRIYLSIMGLFSVTLAMITSYGLCSALGFSFSPLHNFIPFLLLGLGVDDMFVIVQAWDILEEGVEPERPSEGEDRALTKSEDPQPVSENGISTQISSRGSSSLEHKFGLVLKRSGVAITVTSLTDFIAFAVGGTTTLPALRSFCLFCGVGIMSVYVYQANWFIAWMVIDQKRKNAHRNAFCACIKHEKKIKEDEKPKCLKLKIHKSQILEKYGHLLSHPAAKTTVILVTATLLAVSLYGNYELVEEFDPWLFVPSYLYVSRWKSAQDRLFPSKGERVYIFLAGEDRLDWRKLDHLVTNLANQTDILTQVDSWFIHFREYWEYNFRTEEDETLSSLSESDLHALLVRFLFSLKGTRYRYIFDVESPITCGKPLPEIKLHIMTISHKLMKNSMQGISAMNRIKRIIKSSKFRGKVFPFSPLYSIWEIDEIIRSELHRNVSLAIVSIYFATVFLLSDLKASVFVLLCVFITLTNVSGIMHFWDLKIDTVTCTVLIVCIGLSVDFSAHVVHSYMHQRDTNRADRVTKALVSIAPAVLHGGFSTFLAVVLLSVSDVYVLKTFFKIFVLVILFGLFNGLVFLPVVLGLLGPLGNNHSPDLVDSNGDLETINNSCKKTVDEVDKADALEMKSLVV